MVDPRPTLISLDLYIHIYLFPLLFIYFFGSVDTSSLRLLGIQLATCRLPLETLICSRIVACFCGATHACWHLAAFYDFGFEPNTQHTRLKTQDPRQRTSFFSTLFTTFNAHSMAFFKHTSSFYVVVVIVAVLVHVVVFLLFYFWPQ